MWTVHVGTLDPVIRGEERAIAWYDDGTWPKVGEMLKIVEGSRFVRARITWIGGSASPRIRVVSFELDDERYRCTCPTIAEQYGRHVEGCPHGG